MTTISLAKEKWARKMAKAGPRWKKGVTDKAEIYGREMAKFLEIPTLSSERVENYRAGVEAVSPEEFQKAVSGKEEKWAERLKEAMSP